MMKAGASWWGNGWNGKNHDLVHHKLSQRKATGRGTLISSCFMTLHSSNPGEGEREGSRNRASCSLYRERKLHGRWSERDGAVLRFHYQKAFWSDARTLWFRVYRVESGRDPTDGAKRKGKRETPLMYLTDGMVPCNLVLWCEHLLPVWGCGGCSWSSIYREENDFILWSVSVWWTVWCKLSNFIYDNQLVNASP